MSSQVTDEGIARTRYRLCDSLVGGINSRERQSPKSARLRFVGFGKLATGDSKARL
jgi:hypothetical protein